MDTPFPVLLYSCNNMYFVLNFATCGFLSGTSKAVSKKIGNKEA